MEEASQFEANSKIETASQVEIASTIDTVLKMDLSHLQLYKNQQRLIVFLTIFSKFCDLVPPSCPNGSSDTPVVHAMIFISQNIGRWNANGNTQKDGQTHTQLC